MSIVYVTPTGVPQLASLQIKTNVYWGLDPVRRQRVDALVQPYSIPLPGGTAATSANQVTEWINVYVHTAVAKQLAVQILGLIQQP